MKILHSLRRHPVIVATALLLIGLAMWVGYFLANFDLNNYRSQLSSALSQQLGMPVTLGDARLELREAGIAFRFSDLHVGSPRTPVELESRTIWLQLAWTGLLRGKVVFSELDFDTPHLRVDRSNQEGNTSAEGATLFDPTSLGELRFRRIEFQNGQLELNWIDRRDIPHQVLLQEVQGTLSNLALQRPMLVDLSGNLSGNEPRTRLTLKGGITVTDLTALGSTEFDLVIKARSLDAARLAAWLPADWDVAAEGRGSIEINITGRPDSGADIQLQLTGEPMRVQPGPAYQHLIPVKQLLLSGNFRFTETQWMVRRLALQCDSIRLAGELEVTRAPDATRISGKLANVTLPTGALTQWLPDRTVNGSLLFSRLGRDGIFSIDAATFRALFPIGEAGSVDFSVEALHGSAHKLSWPLTGDRTVEIDSLQVDLENGLWEFIDGRGSLSGIPVTLAGTAQLIEGQDRRVEIELSGTATLPGLSATLSVPAPEGLAASGQLGFSARGSGPPGLLAVTGELDLSGVEVRYLDQLRFGPTPGASVTIQGQLGSGTFSLEQGKISLSPLVGTISGNVDWSEQPRGRLSAHLEIPDLNALYSAAPALQRLGIRGGFALDAGIDGPLEAAQYSTSLELRDIAIPAHGVIADITRLNGRLAPKGKGLRSSSMTARIGRSPVTLQAQIADLGNPRLELAVQAPSLRADELIFRSDRIWLRDIDGHLLIDRDGLEFAPVNVRLDGGTLASVRGSVKHFDAPEVNLDISGDYAKVEEIIGLWTDESQEARAARHAHQHSSASVVRPPVRILARARAGDLYGMKFREARAVIVPSDKHLLIHPLDFNTGEGYCNAQVLVDYSGDETLLKVSGHVENADAYAVYNELLDRKSIMRGTLRGNFYIQGEVGSDKGFLPTSYGNFTADVRDGVMRHSPVLSTIFSLLNVSQLFSLQLPDVSTEGLPFTRLATEITLTKGILKTDNLVIDSNAMSMSYVGQYNLIDDNLDLLTVVKPLGTIDKVVSRLPLAGWILTGENRALLTAQFKISGPADKPEIKAVPVTAFSKGVLGIFQRTLGLPLKLIDDPAILWGGGGGEKK